MGWVARQETLPCAESGPGGNRGTCCVQGSRYPTGRLKEGRRILESDPIKATLGEVWIRPRASQAEALLGARGDAGPGTPASTRVPWPGP